MMTQKGIKLITRVRMVSAIVSQLNILCTTLVKPYYTNTNKFVRFESSW